MKKFLFIIVALMIAGCIKPVYHGVESKPQCSQWICDGNLWPGDFTDCTCRGSE